MVNRTGTTGSRSAIAVLAAAVLAAGDAKAVLTARNLLLADDRLITFDSVTGLEWLDLSATNGQSYDAVAAGFGGYTTLYGFLLG